MDDLKTLFLWVLGFLVTIITSVGAWVFKLIFDKLKELENRQNKHELAVKDEFSSLRQELAINSEQDKSRHEQVMLMLNDMKKGQSKIFDKMEEYDKNLSKLYQANPDIVNPDL